MVYAVPAMLDTVAAELNSFIFTNATTKLRAIMLNLHVRTKMTYTVWTIMYGIRPVCSVLKNEIQILEQSVLFENISLKSPL